MTSNIHRLVARMLLEAALEPVSEHVKAWLCRDPLLDLLQRAVAIEAAYLHYLGEGLDGEAVHEFRAGN